MPGELRQDGRSGDAPPPVRGPNFGDEPTLSQTPKAATGQPESTVTVTSDAKRSPSSTARELLPFGEYEILGEVARGGMGVVYKAKQKGLNRTVALKMILSGNLATESDIKRFYTEAEAAAALEHSGIVPIYEIGEQEGQHFYSMAYIDGQSLQLRLKEGPLPPREAAELLRTVAEAVHYAHTKGIIHRDLKPHNILLDGDGNPKVTDFGLAKRLDHGEGMTTTGDILGTPSYMAPEQAAANLNAIGPQTDVYALGAVLYAALTGRPPFQAASLAETLQQVIDVDPVSPRLINNVVPKDLETICLKCLRKPPQQRYGSAQEFSDDLARYLANEPILARPISSTERAIKWMRRQPALASLILVSLVSLLSALAILLVSNDRLAQKTKYAETQQGIAQSQRQLALEHAKKAKTQAELAESRGLSDRRRAYASSMPLVFQSLQGARIDRVLSRLERERPKPGEIDVRGFEWFYLWGQCHEDRATFLGHQGTVNCVVFSPDGALLASGGDDSTIRVHDLKARSTRVLRSQGPVYCLAFLNGGRTLASGSCLMYSRTEDFGVRLWDIETGQMVRHLSLPNSVRALAVSLDNRFLAAAYSEEIAFWKTTEFEQLQVLKGIRDGSQPWPLRRTTVVLLPPATTKLSNSGALMKRRRLDL